MTQLWPVLLLAPHLFCAPLQAQSAPPPAAETDTPVPEFSCPSIIDPVISLDHGSRYIGADKSRSALDAASNADVDAQLGPVDDFITDMILAANAAKTATSPVALNCARDGLLAWAKAGALGDLGSLNAGLSVPGRVAGLAYAWLQIKPAVPDPAISAVIKAWLADLARATVLFFDTQAPPMSRENNLRAWAGLSVALVGTALGDKALTDWAAASATLVACNAAPDGSLPHELSRKHLALHYHMHALSALVTTAAILPSYALFDACNGAIHTSVDYAVAAFADPRAITLQAGAEQSYFTGEETLRSFEIAWAAAYLSLFENPNLAALSGQFDSLANSKLGGQQSLLWGDGE
jgi:poly(beta-D-mannuronate) lyase